MSIRMTTGPFGERADADLLLLVSSHLLFSAVAGPLHLRLSRSLVQLNRSLVGRWGCTKTLLNLAKFGTRDGNAQAFGREGGCPKESMHLH